MRIIPLALALTAAMPGCAPRDDRDPARDDLAAVQRLLAERGNAVKAPARRCAACPHRGIEPRP